MLSVWGWRLCSGLLRGGESGTGVVPGIVDGVLVCVLFGVRRDERKVRPCPGVELGVGGLLLGELDARSLHGVCRVSNELYDRGPQVGSERLVEVLQRPRSSSEVVRVGLLGSDALRSEGNVRARNGNLLGFCACGVVEWGRC